MSQLQVAKEFQAAELFQCLKYNVGAAGINSSLYGSKICAAEWNLRTPTLDSSSPFVYMFCLPFRVVKIFRISQVMFSYSKCQLFSIAMTPKPKYHRTMCMLHRTQQADLSLITGCHATIMTANLLD